METHREWRAACHVQQPFMQRVGPTIETLSHSTRCQVCELGGDCYGFLPLPPNRLALVVGDASGKGLAAVCSVPYHCASRAGSAAEVVRSCRPCMNTTGQVEMRISSEIDIGECRPQGRAG
jgi:hypothetical protein